MIVLSFLFENEPHIWLSITNNFNVNPYLNGSRPCLLKDHEKNAVLHHIEKLNIYEAVDIFSKP